MSRKWIWWLVGIVAVLAVVLGALTLRLLYTAALSSAPSVKREAVLVLTLAGSYPEEPPQDIEAPFGWKKRLTVQDFLSVLKTAKDDPKIKQVYLRMGGLDDVGWAKARELRQGVLDFRESGKTVTAFMEEGTDMAYYLASTGDRIVMPELGTLWVNGLYSRITFLKNTYSKLGIGWEEVKRGKYKSATEPFTRDKMSEPFREMMDALLDDVYQDYLNSVATARNLTLEQAEKIVDDGPYLNAQNALEAGLIDGLSYESEIEKELEIADPKRGKGIEGDAYHKSMLRRWRPRREKIALIYAVGAIMPGKSRSNPFQGKVMGSTTMSKAIREAAEDKSIKAIVFRVDSPGGSALASDIIWRQLVEAKKEKPVVVSMGAVAGSGGYYVSMGADCIVAQPNTITGSIGVLALKPSLKELYQKIGMNIETLTRGENADFFSADRPFTEEEKARLDRFIQEVYDQFVSKAAQGRGKTYEEIHRIAQGRVWSGKRAKEIGLVDELGGLKKAIEIAKEKAGLPPEQKVGLVIYPEKRGILEMLKEGDFFPGYVSQALLKRLPPELRNALQTSTTASLLEDEKILLLMPFEVTIE